MLVCPNCKRDVGPGQRICPGCSALLPRPSSQVVLGPGTVIERGTHRYVLDTRLGAGGMGVVYRAWLFHAPDGPRKDAPPEPVALKALKPEAAIVREVSALFQNEAESLRRLAHPNIVRFVEMFDWGPYQMLAMEYVEGDTLEDVVARHVARAVLAGAGALPGMPFRRAFYYFEQLLGALGAIHALGIVHRDIKPSNVLVRKDGIVKVTDFGIARLHAAGTPGVNTGAMAPGTGAYMPPEQVLSQTVDGRSDLYAAAIVLYEMLSGRTPFAGPPDKTDFAYRSDQVQTPPPPIRTWLAQAPPVLDALFARALAKDKERRFQNPFEMGEAFRQALGFPETPEWRALADFAALAGQAKGPGTAPVTEERRRKLATLADVVVARYGTAKIPVRT
ncbi:MAG: serine/threonine-protein kinase [Polyangiaceae bacterium]